jgi:hypothetical protein
VFAEDGLYPDHRAVVFENVSIDADKTTRKEPGQRAARRRKKLADAVTPVPMRRPSRETA